MKRDDHLMYEAFGERTYAEPELDWFKDKVKSYVKKTGTETTNEEMLDAIERATTGTNPHFFEQTLHNELLKTRGKMNRKRKFKDQGYYPPEDKWNWDYMRNWLHKEIFGNFLVKKGYTIQMPR